MRSGHLVAATFLAACGTEPNPDYCDEMRPCALGVCDLTTNRCVPPSDAPLDGEPGSVDANIACQSAGGRLAWRSRRDGDDEIIVSYADGSHLTPRTNNAAFDSNPVWSWNGEKIAWIQGPTGSVTDVLVMAHDGAAVVNLTNSPGARDTQPAWSPDGSKIAFASTRDGNYEVYVVDSTGGVAQNLTNNDAVDWAPQWSPDGTSIAFESDRDGNEEIYVMSSDGTLPTRITIEPGNDSDPVWSPDGQRIAFVSTRPNVSAANVWTMDPNGGGLANLTQLDIGDGGASGPAWSPDGATIAYVHRPHGGTTTTDVWRVAASGGLPSRLTTADGDDGDAHWSPDGARLTFSSERDGNMEIYTMAADGSEQVNVSQDPDYDSSPSWGRCQ